MQSEQNSNIESSQQSNVQSSPASVLTSEPGQRRMNKSPLIRDLKSWQSVPVMARIWLRMTEVYGHRWISAWGEVTNPDGTLTSTAFTWVQGLGRFSLDEIGQGFEKMVENGNDWPPTLPEFMTLCKPKRTAPYHKMARMLPQPEVDMGTITSNLCKMRAILTRTPK